MGETYRLRGPLLGLEESAGATEELWVHDGALTDVDPGVPAADLRGFVLPGLVDMHCHIGLGPTGSVDAETALQQAHADVQAGTLLVRDAGSPTQTRWLEPRTDVPRIIRAGRHLARPKRYIRGYARELEDVADLPRAMAEEAARGDGWVKLVGDWIERSNGTESVLEPLWPEGVLREGIEAAHEAGARVTVHTFDTRTVAQMLTAGVDCIEHGTGMRRDHMLEAAERGVPVVPTLMQVSTFDKIAAQAAVKYPRYAEQMHAMHAARHAQIRAMHDCGVELLLGTDAGGNIGHGRLPAEAQALVETGVPVAEVVAAASWRGREFLGAPGLRPGAPADVVVYPSDPRRDITVLARPAAIIRAGVRLR